MKMPVHQKGEVGKKQMVKQEEDFMTIKAIQPLGLIPLLTKGMQELSQENKRLKEEIEMLKNDLLVLSKDMNAIKKSIR